MLILNRSLSALAATALAVLPATLPAQLENFDPFAAAEKSSSKLEFLSEVKSVAPGKPFHIAIKLTHPAGWYSYFQNPGYVGQPLKADWNLPAGFTVERVAWPVPQRSESSGKNSYVYKKLVYHLFKITPPANLTPGNRVKVAAAPNWLICSEDNCVREPSLSPPYPIREITLPVAVQAEIDPTHVETFKAARAMLPRPLPDTLTLQASKSSGGVTLLLSPASAVPPEADIHFFDYEEVLDAQSESTVERDEDGVRWTLAGNQDAEPENPDQLAGILTIGDRGYLVEVDYGTAAKQPVSFSKLLAVLGGMFLGGMILNLMPCVFPVIGIKIMGFVQQAGEDRRTIFVHGLIYAAGVLVSFWALSAIALALREGGNIDVTQGFQLQNPWVVWVLMLIMFTLAMNMFGIFEIGTSATSVGSNLTHKQGMGGSFFSGVLATLVATPCSAPFLAVAIGIAFGLPPALFLLSFTVMALGLAAPYVLLSAFPRLVEKLPRPGPWMESFKQAMAFLLFGTAGWMLWILVSFKQVGSGGMLPIVLGLTLIGIALWVYGRWCPVSRTKRARRIGFVAMIVFGGLGLASSKPPGKGLEWETWSPEVVDAALAEGRPVFVDFTATWCATCQVNKSRAYNGAVRNLFKKHNILALKADFTDYDPAIAEALGALERKAVPVNALYLPGADEAILTRELFGSGYMSSFIEEHLGSGSPSGRAPETR